MRALYQEIAHALANLEPVILATVVESQGSTPRKAGAWMAMFTDGRILGSVGGGGVEAAVVNRARQIGSQGGALIEDFEHNEGAAADSGMICGGTQRILIRLIHPGESEQRLFRAMADSGKDAAQRIFITSLKGPGPRFDRVEIGLLDAGGTALGYRLDSKLKADLLAEIDSRTFPVWNRRGGHTVLLERVASQGTLFIFGAGHVARPTLTLAAQVGFRTVVLDDRPEFAHREYFPHSDQIILLESFSSALVDVDVGEDAYVIIVTRGHRHDQTVLEQALATPAAYIGMIGSKRKIATCFANLAKRGWQKEDLARVHAPIGLDIGSETPEEIAVSIVAQLISVRARLQGKQFGQA